MPFEVFAKFFNHQVFLNVCIMLCQCFMLHIFVYFVNISAYIPTEIPTKLSNLFYTNSFYFIFIDVNVDVKYAIYSDLVICNNFLNYKVFPAFNFHFIGLELSQLLQTDLTLKRKCCNDYCLCLVLLIFPSMFACVPQKQT